MGQRPLASPGDKQQPEETFRPRAAQGNHRPRISSSRDDVAAAAGLRLTLMLMPILRGSSL